jgi:hypothetical protein
VSFVSTLWPCTATNKQIHLFLLFTTIERIRRRRRRKRRRRIDENDDV